jgi:PAS domain S-box-containing protein
MDSVTVSHRFRRKPTSLLPAVLGLVIVVVTASHLASGGEPRNGVLVATGVLLVLSVPLLGGTVWLLTRPFDAREIRRIVSWVLAGAIPITLLATVVVFYQSTHGVALAHPFIITTWVAGVGAIGGFLTGTYDVRRVRRQERYEDTSRRLRALIEASPVAIVAIDSNGDVTDWSRAATDLFGWEREEILGESYPLVPDYKQSEFDEHLGRVNSGETLTGVETERQRKDGSSVEVGIWSAPIERGGTVDEHMVALVDISDRKARERELKLLSRAIEQADDAVLITDDDGIIEYVNEAFVELFGYPREQALGRTPAILKSGQHEESFYADLWGTITAGDVFQAEVTNRRANGELLDSELTIAPVEDGEAVTHYVAIERDVTDRKRNRQRLEVLNRVLRHNVRNAVTVVQGNARRITDECNDAAARTLVDAIERRTEELQSAVEKARTVERALDTDRTGSINVHSLVDDQRVRFEDHHPRTSLTVDVPPDLWVQANATLEAALQEALENAAEHAESPADAPCVRVVATATDDDQVDICIVDDGPGVPDHERQVLEAGEESDLRHGSGLGLWVMKWVVTSLGGEVAIDYPTSGGTVVTFSLPRAHPAE